jgi:hypothetical protein
MILCLGLEVQQQPKRKKKEVLPVNQPLPENQSNEYTGKTCFKFVDGSGYCKQCPLGKYACMVTVGPIQFKVCDAKHWKESTFRAQMFDLVASQINQLQQANKLDKDVAKCQHCKGAVTSRVYMETLGPNCTPARQMHFCTSITKSTCCI